MDQASGIVNEVGPAELLHSAMDPGTTSPSINKAAGWGAAARKETYFGVGSSECKSSDRSD